MSVSDRLALGQKGEENAEVEAQRGEVTCPRPHSKEVAKKNLISDLCDSKLYFFPKPPPQSLLCLFRFFRRMKYSNDIYFRGERRGNCWKSHSEPAVCPGLDPWRQTLTPASPPTALRHLMVGLLPFRTPALPCLGAQEMMATIHAKPQGKFSVWAGLESSQSPSSDVPSHMQRAGGM